MRLTLRTLLAYLDDTLEPHEIKEIGQKVAESDAAQELIARIKQVTRRRRLTTPPQAGPNSKFDANTIAEYLDNELSTELVAELEKTCLESDVHLAEVASCHQILTLVLGEPALVPPTARERMYGLVKGPEAIPFRKARGRDGAGADDEEAEANGEDALLPGLPTSRGWLLWALPVAAVLVLVVLGVAVWQALPPENKPPVHVADNGNTNPAPVGPQPADHNPAGPVPPVEAQPATWTAKAARVDADKLTLVGADNKETTVTVPPTAKITIDGKEGKLENVAANSSVTVTQTGDVVASIESVSPETTFVGKAVKVEGRNLTLKNADNQESTAPIPESAKIIIDGKEGKLDQITPDSIVAIAGVGDAITRLEVTTVSRPKPPSTVRAQVGQYVPPPTRGPSILTARPSEQASWKRLTLGSPVFTTDQLVSLPGYNSEIDLGPDAGAQLLLHGHVPQFTVHDNPLMDFLMESAVRLNQPEAGFDVDLTLDRGRIYLSNHKADGPVKVRLRFGGDATKTPAAPQEVWDLTLVDRDAEVGVDLVRAYTGDINYRDGEAPLQLVFLFALAGKVGVQIESRPAVVTPAPFLISWNNKGAGASPVQPIDPKAMEGPTGIKAVWSKTPPAGATQQEKDVIAQMKAALDGVDLVMTDKRTIEEVLLEVRKSEEYPMRRILAIYCFGALDDLEQVLDVLCYDGDQAHAVDRAAAVAALRRWISRNPANGDRLYNPRTETGLLVDKRHMRLKDADDILQALHDFPKDDAHKPATFEVLTDLLGHKELAIRELAYWHLLNLSAGARVPLPPYNAGWDETQRAPAIAAWKKLVENKDLPPPPPGPAPPR